MNQQMNYLLFIYAEWFLYSSMSWIVNIVDIGDFSIVNLSSSAGIWHHLITHSEKPKTTALKSRLGAERWQ